MNSATLTRTTLKNGSIKHVVTLDGEVVGTRVSKNRAYNYALVARLSHAGAIQSAEWCVNMTDLELRRLEALLAQTPGDASIESAAVRQREALDTYRARLAEARQRKAEGYLYPAAVHSYSTSYRTLTAAEAARIELVAIAHLPAEA